MFLNCNSISARVPEISLLERLLLRITQSRVSVMSDLVNMAECKFEWIKKKARTNQI